MASRSNPFIIQNSLFEKRQECWKLLCEICSTMLTKRRLINFFWAKFFETSDFGEAGVFGIHFFMLSKLSSLKERGRLEFVCQRFVQRRTHRFFDQHRIGAYVEVINHSFKYLENVSIRVMATEYFLFALNCRPSAFA